MKFWTKEQFEAFLACVERPSARAGFSLLFWTGIRIGELLALTLNDFDFEKKTLSVSKSFQSIKGREVITEPKTQKSKRVTLCRTSSAPWCRNTQRASMTTPGRKAFPVHKVLLSQGDGKSLARPPASRKSVFTTSGILTPRCS